MVIPYVFKKCTKCGRWLVASNENFYKHKTGKYGLEPKCKECRKKYLEEKKEARAEYYKEYRKKNKEATAKQKKKYRQTPKGQISRANERARRRVREQEQGNGITVEQWLECMGFFEFKCAYSGIPLSEETRNLDHIIPLAKGGEHEIWNLVPMYKYYNFSKRDKDLLTWYPKQDFFDKERLAKIYEWKEYAFKKWGRENLTEAE